MRILLSWLEDFVDIQESPQELAHALTMAGMAVDAIEEEDGETVFEFDITSNRPDAMNHRGMAREISAIYGRSLRAPSSSYAEIDPPSSEHASVVIQVPEECTRYVGRVLTGVTIQPSPGWMQRRLDLCGVRPINNLADLTNYVLLEMGQPTHAFDLDKLAGRAIVVRRAEPGETLVTLDGQSRTLEPDHLAICDAEKPIALAGVMGGADSEITAETQNVLLEAAWFKPSRVRRATRAFKLHTDASHRFERGADWEGTVEALDRISGLLGQTAAVNVHRGVIDCHPNARPLVQINLARRNVERHIGIAVPDTEVEAILRSLGFEPAPSETGWTVGAVSARLDVEREIDLIEEIARIYGFERVPATLPPARVAPPAVPAGAEDARMRATVRGLGYHETIGFPFDSVGDADRFGRSPAVALRNPLSRTWEVMRTSPIPTMLRALEWNLRRNQSFVRLAEFGRMYERSNGRNLEPKVLALGASGTRRPVAWSDSAEEFGFYDLKADLAALLEPFATDTLQWDPSDVPNYYRTGHAASVRSGSEALAFFGQIDPSIARKRKVRASVWVAEILLEPVYRLGLRIPAHRSLPKVPAVWRDFSLIVPNTVTFASIVDAVGEMPDLSSLEPVEVMRSKNLPPDRYGLLLRAAWQRLDESLTDQVVNGFAATVRRRLETRLGITVRT